MRKLVTLSVLAVTMAGCNFNVGESSNRDENTDNPECSIEQEDYDVQDEPLISNDNEDDSIFEEVANYYRIYLTSSGYYDTKRTGTAVLTFQFNYNRTHVELIAVDGERLLTNIDEPKLHYVRINDVVNNSDTWAVFINKTIVCTFNSNIIR